MNKEKLFDEFLPVATIEWKEKIIKDLKDADYDKKLVWETGEGFDVQPFYRSEDIRNLPHMNVFPGSFPYVRGNEIRHNKWLVRQDIKVQNIADANRKAVDISLKGVDSLGYYFDQNFKPDVQSIEDLCENIRADLVELNFNSTYPLEIVKIIISLVKKYNRDPDKVRGCVEYDPIGDFSQNGHFSKSEDKDLDLLRELHSASAQLPKFQYLNINATIFNNAGAGIVNELAFSMAMAAEYLTYLTDSGLDIDEVAPRIRFHFSVGSDYFMEIAKLRAAKYLWAKIVNAYGLVDASNAAMYIHCTNSQWNKTVYDPYVNMLRTTTESMSAILGGINSLIVLPFNSVYETETEFSARIARNQQLVLKEESYLDKVADIGAGSYYIENLTDKLIHNAWAQFLKIDEEGGYLSAFKKGIIQKTIRDEASKKDKDIATRKKLLLGVNQYPNIGEHYNKEFKFKKNNTEKNGEAEPLILYRGGEKLEELRLRTDKFSEKNKRPAVWMFTYGKLAMQKARAQFAGNFFGCAGFEIIDNPGFKTIEKGIRAAKVARPEIVVICSSDEEYADIVEPIFNALKEETIIVLAGYPKDLIGRFKEIGMTNFIHVKSNLLEELIRYQKLLLT
ncbi:MAG: acyl-CoA mutase large subunit family protein [Bacteroidetes bacterium]|nr:acyl-CoA mutase large subunit family protein [Bacteroidota bacterium]MBL6943251.1 acyl-CoA mutase large subunit family protein [Bacteroidales bacterium]